MGNDYLKKEIVKVLKENNTTYASPMNSTDIGEKLNVTPSYIRKVMADLINQGKAGVRRGIGGGYFYINKEDV